jgi:hypothetical protein
MASLPLPLTLGGLEGDQTVIPHLILLFSVLDGDRPF